MGIAAGEVVEPSSLDPTQEGASAEELRAGVHAGTGFAGMREKVVDQSSRPFDGLGADLIGRVTRQAFRILRGVRRQVFGGPPEQVKDEGQASAVALQRRLEREGGGVRRVGLLAQGVEEVGPAASGRSTQAGETRLGFALGREGAKVVENGFPGERPVRGNGLRGPAGGRPGIGDGEQKAIEHAAGELIRAPSRQAIGGASADDG